jgi:hypothetical protein
MSILDLLVIVGCVAIGVWIVRSVMQPGVDLIDEGRRAAERLADNLREHEVRTPPGPRSTPQVRRTGAAAAPRRSDAAARRNARDAAAPVRPGSPPRKAPSPSTRDTRLDDWYLLLDVSPAASRREIQEALRLRVARARADRDGETVRRLLRAAAAGIAHPRGPED